GGQGLTLAVTAEGSVSIATQLDDDPLTSDRVWREMSLQLPVYLSAGARPKPTSHVLIAANGPQPGAEPDAFLSWQYVGLGRVIKLLELREDPASPGVYRATFDDLPLGPITLRAAGAAVQSLLAEENHPEAVEQVLNVDPKASSELGNPLCNLQLLQQIADAS